MIPVRGASILLLAAAGAVIAAGCQSTQDKSAQIAAELGPVKAEKGLEIGKESKDIEILDTALLTDANGTAVVVDVKNNSDETLTNVPILIDVFDAKGKSVYRNDIPGLEPTLTSIPILEPGETLSWVNNQVLPIGEPKEVEVEVGAEAKPLDEEIPDIAVGEPQLENDPVSGINAAGTATNNTAEEQESLLIYGVARRDGEIAAAGRAVIDRLKPERQRTYHVYFIGDPKGAEISVASFPSLQSTKEEEASANG